MRWILAIVSFVLVSGSTALAYHHREPLPGYPRRFQQRISIDAGSFQEKFTRHHPVMGGGGVRFVELTWPAALSARLAWNGRFIGYPDRSFDRAAFLRATEQAGGRLPAEVTESVDKIVTHVKVVGRTESREFCQAELLQTFVVRFPEVPEARGMKLTAETTESLPDEPSSHCE